MKTTKRTKRWSGRVNAVCYRELDDIIRELEDNGYDVDEEYEDEYAGEWEHIIRTFDNGGTAWMTIIRKDPLGFYVYAHEPED